MHGFANPSRRRLVQQAACAAGILAASLKSAQAKKASQAAASYQNAPNQNQSCSRCQHFRPPSSCQVVEGRISPNGWCRLYYGRA
jgi:hypothetical protein